MERVIIPITIVYLMGFELWGEFEFHIFFFLFNVGVRVSFARTSTNLMGPEVNDHVSLQWPSYEQP
jgi:hypothetical protein